MHPQLCDTSSLISTPRLSDCRTCAISFVFLIPIKSSIPRPVKMPPKKSESSADIARHVISQLENSDAFKLIVKSAVREAVADLAVRLEEQEARVLELEVQVKAQASEIEQLKKAKESTHDAAGILDSKLDALDQYSRRNNVRIHGMEETVGESTEEVVCKVAQRMGLKLTQSDIDLTHRLGPGTKPAGGDKPDRSIIVKFSSYRTRALFIGARMKLKGSGIYVNEDLTARKQKLFHAVRHCKKAVKAWSIDGRIFAGLANTSDNGRLTKKLITCEEDLANL